MWQPMPTGRGAVGETAPAPDQRPRGLSAVAGHLAVALLWLLHWLPLPLLAVLGRGLGALLWRLAPKRRRIALRNLELCFPDWTAPRREQVAREHFGWLGRSVLERGLLWYASARRLRRLILVEGDVRLAERSEQPLMLIVPHFVGLDVVATAAVLFQDKTGATIYQRQSLPALDAAARRGRTRFGKVILIPRDESARALIRAIRAGMPFFNLPDMDFGLRDSAFVPFFGVPACTLLAPSRMARALGMVVQSAVVEMLPGGRGYRVRFSEPWPHFPTDDPMADTQALNHWLEQEIRRLPAQYLWVHRRFKTRPPGEPSLYG